MRVRERFRRFAAKEAWPASPRYARLARAVADDEGLGRSVATFGDVEPNLLFAAVQYLTGPVAMPADGRALLALLERRGDEVRELVGRRRVQTNEVARCAVLLPALPEGPLALLEVGASAGLCLLLDRFAYRYGRLRLGASGAAVELRCRVYGSPPLPGALPEVAWRRGVDLAPVDLDDPDDVRWLRACVWSDQPERRARLEAALALARVERPPVERGDLVDELPRLVAEAPDDATLVVFHGGVLPYLEPERREDFRSALRRASRLRPIVWISNEAPGVVLEPPPGTPSPPRLRFLLGRARLADGVRTDEALAWAHPHGTSLRWLGRSADELPQGARSG